MHRKYIKDLSEGQDVDEVVFVLFESSIGTARNGSKYRRMVLADKTGQIPAIQWGVKDKGISSGEAVSVTGSVDSYKGDLQIKVVSIKAVPESGHMEDLVPVVSKKELDRATERVSEIINSIQNETLKSLVSSILYDEKYIDRMAESPAGISAHHTMRGELLTHSVEVADISVPIASYLNLDIDLVASGALLHDIGKVACYSQKGPSIQLTLAGGYIDHIVIGSHIVFKAADKLRDSGQECDGYTIMRLAHMILSHHGKHEWSSPVVPVIPEAQILHYADMISFQINRFRMVMEKSNDIWSQYDRILERRIHAGACKNGPKNSPGSCPEESRGTSV